MEALKKVHKHTVSVHNRTKGNKVLGNGQHEVLTVCIDWKRQ